MGELDAAGASDEDIHQVTWRNACRFFSFDPFEHRRREEATVGVLRAAATDVDVSESSRTVYRDRYLATAG
jgi:hypothetical protein